MTGILFGHKLGLGIAAPKQGGGVTPPNPNPIVDGYRVGDTGGAGSLYEGYTLAYADDFTATIADLFVVPHKSPSSAASIAANKYLLFQTYRIGSDQPGGQLTQSTDTNPFNTGRNDANRGVPVGSDNNRIASGVLTLGARYTTPAERAAYGADRPLASGVLMTDTAIVAHVDERGTGDVIFEVRYRRSASGSTPGGHTDFWTRTVEPDANGSTTFDVNHENFSFNYLPATLDPAREPKKDAQGNIVLDGNGNPIYSEEYHTADPGNMHTYTYVQSKDHSQGILLYRDGVLEARGYTSANVPDKNTRILLTNHIVDSEAGNLAGWIAGGIYNMEIDYIRVWNRTARKRYKPLATIPDQNIPAGGSVTITLPSKADLWGDTDAIEFVQQVQSLRNSPGGSDTTAYTNANPFGPGCSYNAGTRQLTVAPTDGKSGRAIFTVYARTPGSTCQPLVIVVNVGPKINVASLSYTAGTAGSYDLYAAVDCGELTTDGVGKAKTISVSGLPSGFSYNDATGILSWTTAATGAATAGITATNSIGQTATGNLSISSASVPVPSEDAVTTAWVNAMPVSPSQARRQLMNDMIAGLRTDGILAKLGRLGIFAGHEQASALVDVIQPSKAWSMVGGGTFTVDRGITGDGVASYISMGENVIASGTLAAQDSVTYGLWVNQQNGGTGLFSQTAENVSGSRFQIAARGNAGNDTFRVSDATADALRVQGGSPSRTGHRTAVRTGSTVKKGYFNGSLTATLATASSGGSQAAFVIFKNSTTYCPDRAAVAYVGTAFSDTDTANFHSRMNTYLSAFGGA